jgi:DNA-directed RNA polymerase specialized sigma24 family protein
MVCRSCRPEHPVNRSREPNAGEPPSLLSDEAEAVAMLFRNVAPKLLAPALLWTQGNRPQAEDPIQEVFLTAIRKWEEVGRLGFPHGIGELVLCD